MNIAQRLEQGMQRLFILLRKLVRRLVAIALALGFAILTLSSFAVTSLMGVLSAMIIVIAMLADLLLLPALLLTFGEAKT